MISLWKNFKKNTNQRSSKNSDETGCYDLPKTEWSGDNCKPITVKEYLEPQLHPDKNFQNIVRETRSFADLIAPRVDLKNGQIGLQDLTSTGRLFDVIGFQSEARSEKLIDDIFTKVHFSVAQVLPMYSQNPWITQWFIQDEDDVEFRATIKKIRSYIDIEILKTPYSQHWIETVDCHFADLSRKQGFFTDSNTVGKIWRGKIRKIRFCIWRTVSARDNDRGDNIDQICSQLQNAFAQANIKLIPRDAAHLFAWLSKWFAPTSSHLTRQSESSTAGATRYWDPTDLERSLSIVSPTAGFDIGRAALHGVAPWTWRKPGVWWFQSKPSRFLTVDEITGEPEIGHITAERYFGDSIGTLWDQMPSNSIWSMTVIYSAQDDVQEKISIVRKNSVGDSATALERRKLAEIALGEIARGNPILRMYSGIFLFGKNLSELDKKTESALGILSANKVKVISPRYDPIALDSYVRALPFGFVPEQDQKIFARRARLNYSSHIARLIPVFTRSTGTGFPGFILFNRGAEPLMFDPLNPMDRSKNAHSLVLGPTGSGKTAFLIYFLLHAVAVHRPRVVLVTALPTFGLFADHCERLGLTVHRVKIDGKSEVALPPFKHAQVLLDQQSSQLSMEFDVEDFDESESIIRDPLGEMEIQARLMITGGETSEEQNLRRDDMDMIRSAILSAAEFARSENRTQTLTSDVVRILRQASKTGKISEHELSKEQKQRVARMAGAMHLFCTGLNGKLFDREGELWPDTDISLVEMDLLARRGYEDRLAIALTSLFSAINNRIEANQYEKRQTLVVIDEAHILLQNPLAAPYINRISAMWRTFGAWLWVATQNIRQFPEQAKELLNQPEWWFCLSVDKDEIDQINRFKALTEEQKELLISARKSFGKYTEGAVLSTKLMTLFRNVPPSLALALSQTEKSEKAKRAQIMKERNISEIDAAYVIAEAIRLERLDSHQENMI